MKEAVSRIIGNSNFLVIIDCSASIITSIANAKHWKFFPGVTLDKAACCFSLRLLNIVVNV